jgi:hypothetical protein
MADKKVTELTAITTVSGDDLLLVVNDPLGTPASRKVSVGNLFGNVTSETTHRKPVTFTSNVSVTGTTITSTANVAITGDLSVNGYSVVTELDSKITTDAATLLINDRLQVANANVLLAGKAANSFVTSNYVTNTVFQNIRSSFGTGLLNVSTLANTAALAITTKSSDPATSNAANEGIAAGSVFYSNTHLYVATDSNTIKRVELSTF